MTQQSDTPAPARQPTEGVQPPVRESQPFPGVDRGTPAAPVAEQDLWSGRAHWHSSIGRVLAWFVLSVGLIVVAIYVPRTQWLTTSRLAWAVFIIIAIATLYLIGGIVIRVLQTRYRLTNQRLFIERGIFSRTLDQTELIRVDDVRMQQSFVNRIFGIGNITMLTTDMTDKSVAIVGVKEPVRVTELVRQQMRTLRGKSVYIETL